MKPKKIKSEALAALHESMSGLRSLGIIPANNMNSFDESCFSSLAEESIQNSIWKTTSIEQTPNLELRSWRIYEVSSKFWEGRTRHFSGYNVTEREGRASTQIAEFDKGKMVGRTESGRIYNLVGPAGYDKDATYVWDCYCRRNQLFDITDVTEEYTSYAAPNIR